MGNSTVKLQSIVDYARTYPDLNPVLSTGGFSQEPALTIANDVMTAFMAPGRPWKFNRTRLPFFYTNSFQQDYALPGTTNVAWLEYGILIDINSTTEPKAKYTLECGRDLPESSVQFGRPGQVCWLPNDQLIYGTWGGSNTGEGTLSNPGPGSVYGFLLGATAQPSNPLLQIQDPNGNLWVLTNALTQNVTLGGTQPVWPATSSIRYPTPGAPNTAATTVSDGTGVWTAVNPKGQGLRLNPVPSQQGKVWQGRVFGQARPVQFTSLSQTIDPIPDDYAAYFRRGFVAYSFMHSKDPKVRAKFQDQQALWIKSIEDAGRSMDRERDNTGIVPSESIMPGPGGIYLGPGNPYYTGGY